MFDGATHVCFDYETALTNGIPSTKFYSPDFRVVSCAWSWLVNGELKNLFIQGEDEVGKVLEAMVAEDVTAIVFNLSFEYGVTLFRYPHIKIKKWIDSQRLAQCFDNGGSDFAEDRVFDLDAIEAAMLDAVDGQLDFKPIKKKSITGFSLTNCVKRILPEEFHDHKKEAYDYLRGLGVKKGKEGVNLHLLPLELLASYNVGDSDNTYRLYTTITEKFKEIGYDWRVDHGLYVDSVKRVATAEARGIHVDRVALEHYRIEVEEEIKQIEIKFKEKYDLPIRRIEWRLKAAIVDKLKTVKGKTARWKKFSSDPVMFNLGSNKQLADLCTQELGMVPKFFTDKGRPSFRSAFLGQWGELGEMLLTRRKRLLVLGQSLALLELSKYDGLYHQSLKNVGTKTGRYASGSY